MSTHSESQAEKADTGPTAYTVHYRGIDFRQHPELYRIGHGEQGVLLVEPYKSELLPLWKFRTPEDARQSAEAIYQKFLAYRGKGDFVGMDMARKYLQMGYTRSRRYANHRSGQKYDGPVPDDKKGQSGAHGREVLPPDPDPLKAESARIFKAIWLRVQQDQTYCAATRRHREQYETVAPDG